MSKTTQTPAQLRNMFGANLRQLSQDYSSISALARQLGINRTQFNRYLSGESFPRPDVLARICDFFDIDARVLLEPVGRITRSGGPILSSFLDGFMGADVQTLSEEDFPTGFYHFTRRSFVRENEFVRGLVRVHREDGCTFVRGYEPKLAMAIQGIPPAPHAREYRGFVIKVEDGLALMAARRNGLTGSINYLNRVNSFENNYWVGYVARTVRENSSSERMNRLVYEYLGKDKSRIMHEARSAGFCDYDALLPYHQRLLQPADPFR